MDDYDLSRKADVATEVQDLCAHVKGEEQKECIEFYEDLMGSKEDEESN